MNAPQECAFYVAGGYCMAKTISNCKHVCQHAQTHGQREKRIHRAYKLINTLPFKQQIHISQKYYSGSMPWKLI